MRTLHTILFSFVTSAAVFAKHPAITSSYITLPTGVDAQIGGIDIMPNGKIACAFHEGDVRLYDPSDDSWSVFASGLHEPLGIVAEDDHTVTVVQRPEITVISDTDHDGTADSYKTLCDDFGLSGNYHEFAFGPLKDSDGNYYISLNVASNGKPIREEIRGEWLDLGLPREKFVDKDWKKIKNDAGRMFSRVPYRGWIMKINGETGEMTPWASGLRSPNGLAFGPDGKLYCSDNQGDWLGTSKLYHIEKDNFYGHPASLPWTKGYKGPSPLEIPAKKLDEMRTPAAIWFPQNSMANSPTQSVTIPDGFGPFGGQMLIGEMNKSRIIRLIIEEVNGITQGACTPLIDGNGLDMGINRLAFDKENNLIVGHSHLSWPGGEGLGKLSFDNSVSFQGIKDIKITPKGFAVELLQPVESLDAFKESTLRRYTFKYHKSYGSPQLNKDDVELTVKPINGSKTKFHLTLNKPHKKDFCYEFNFPLCQNSLLCYTVREVPKK